MGFMDKLKPMVQKGLEKAKDPEMQAKAKKAAQDAMAKRKQQQAQQHDHREHDHDGPIYIADDPEVVIVDDSAAPSDLYDSDDVDVSNGDGDFEESSYEGDDE